MFDQVNLQPHCTNWVLSDFIRLASSEEMLYEISGWTVFTKVGQLKFEENVDPKSKVKGALQV